MRASCALLGHPGVLLSLPFLRDESRSSPFAGSSFWEKSGETERCGILQRDGSVFQKIRTVMLQLRTYGAGCVATDRIHAFLCGAQHFAVLPVCIPLLQGR